MSMKEQEFCCKRAGLTIRGVQHLPDDFDENRKYPTVLISHGFMGNYLSVADYCRDFASMGYVAFGFNFCGGGKLKEEDSLKSEGATYGMTIETEIEDLLAVKSYAKSQPYVDAENLILVGVSQGGFVSGLTAARCGEEIKKLIMIYPALCIPDHARRGCLGGASYDPQNVPERIDCGKSVLGRTFHETVVGMEPYLELSPYQGPVLLLQGLSDRTVNYSYAIRAKESYREGQCRLQLIRDMGHGPNEEQRESMRASIRQFLTGKEEILTIRVIITDCESVTEGNITKRNIFFNGYCETKYFQGTILPGACDVQEYDADVQTKIKAEYTLEGLDIAGEKCLIHIVNQRSGQEWKPVIKTDSAALAWLNHADLTAVLEGGTGGPTVRIYANITESIEKA